MSIHLEKRYDPLPDRSNLGDDSGFNEEPLHGEPLPQKQAAKALKDLFIKHEISTLYQSANESLQAADKEYHQIARPPKEAEKLRMDYLQKKWQTFVDLALKIEKLGFYVFFHAACFEISLLHQMRTYLDSSRQDITKKSNWNFFKRFRDNPTGQLKFSNTQNYFESQLCQAINDPQSGITDRWPSSQWMMSCDGFLENKDPNESAFSFYKNNFSYSSSEELFKAFFQNKFKNHWICSAFGAGFIKELFNFVRFSATKLGKTDGNLFFLAVPKESLQDSAISYVWRSHPFGRACGCIAQNHEDFISHLESDQTGKPQPCQVSQQKIILNPQYRMLAENFDADPKKLVLSFDGLSDEQKKLFKDQMFWPFSYLFKQLAKLAEVDAADSFEKIDSILISLPLDLSYLLKRVQHPYISNAIKSLEPLYQLAATQLIVEKKNLIELQRQKLSSLALGNFEKYLEKSLDLDSKILDLICLKPESTSFMSSDQMLEILDKILKNDPRRFSSVVNKLSSSIFLKVIDHPLCENLFEKVLELKDIEIGAKFLAASPSRPWNISKTIDLKSLYLKAISANPEVIQHLPPELLLTEEFALEAIQANYHVFRYFSKEWKKHKKLAVAGLKLSPDVYDYLDPALKKDPTIKHVRDFGSD